MPKWPGSGQGVQPWPPSSRPSTGASASRSRLGIWGSTGYGYADLRSEPDSRTFSFSRAQGLEEDVVVHASIALRLSSFSFGRSPRESVPESSAETGRIGSGDSGSGPRSMPTAASGWSMAPPTWVCVSPRRPRAPQTTRRRGCERHGSPGGGWQAGRRPRRGSSGWAALPKRNTPKKTPTTGPTGNTTPSGGQTSSALPGWHMPGSIPSAGNALTYAAGRTNLRATYRPLSATACDSSAAIAELREHERSGSSTPADPARSPDRPSRTAPLRWPHPTTPQTRVCARCRRPHPLARERPGIGAHRAWSRSVAA